MYVKYKAEFEFIPPPEEEVRRHYCPDIRARFIFDNLRFGSKFKQLYLNYYIFSPSTYIQAMSAQIQSRFCLFLSNQKIKCNTSATKTFFNV